MGKEVLDCIVFWSKNPEPFFPFLPELEKMGIPFYFQFTLNPYGKALEQNLPSVEHRVKTFLRLGEMLGSRRLVWRYDPVIINGEYSVSWHQAQFEKLCGQLSGAACRCVFSFYDRYSGSPKAFCEAGEEQMLLIAERFSRIAARYGLPLFTCCEGIDLSSFGIAHGACVDPQLVGEAAGFSFSAAKDKNQRKHCGCAESVDIGSYNSCTNGCLYCYADRSLKSARENFLRHDPDSPMLLGWPLGTEIIKEYPARSLKEDQLTLF